MPENNNHKEKTDEELVNLSLNNQDCFLYLMKRYEKKLLAYILKISSFNHDEAEDILQEVFIKIYKNLNDFDTGLKFSSWAYRITHNQVISHYRKVKSRPQAVSLDLNDKILANLSSDLDIREEIDISYFKKNVKKILENLDIKYREVLVLKFLEEKGYKEISDILKKPMGTVATLINRAKREFRQELERQKIKI
ncbi:MAG: RNA polymerase sigma factor [Patescibacteria group bacterium]|nr:RNA polymerase sigma factor [Patescibacteria group bacterium]